MPIVGPLVTGLAMIYIYPIPAKKVYEHWRIKQRELKEIQQKIDDESPLTKEEARQIKREAFEMEIKFDQELERRTNEITQLREVIADLQKPKKEMPIENVEGLPQGPTSEFAKLTLEREERIKTANELEKTVQVLKDKVASYEAALQNNALTKEQDNLLVTIAQYGKINLLQMNSGPNKVKAEYNIDVLRSTNLVTGDSANIILTPKGRKYLVDKNLIK